MNSDTPRFLPDPRDGVLRRPGSRPFAYSDGEEVEKRIHYILSRAKDVSTASAELKANISDWPTEYHFSAIRHNLLRHLPITPNCRILEIGAGCGSITRWLGETGARVVALEGSLARARCARMRCKELENVEVYCSNFEDFDVDCRFDVVTLIGVLEYAPLYIGGSDPLLACLELAIRYLKPDGVLVLAIENQLGLKYFCGYPEDHLSQPYFGIQDLYHGRTVRTVGKAELHGLLERAGFLHIEYQYPFPDYKLASMVFMERAFETAGFRPEELIRQMRSRDYTGVPRELIAEHLIWPVVGRNGLVRDLSNSFLAFATLRRSNPFAPAAGLLAVGYTNDRASPYNTVKRFTADARGEIWVTRTPAAPSSGLAGTLAHLCAPEKYIEGKHLGAEMERCIAVDDWPAFAEYFRRWMEFLLEHGTKGAGGTNILETELAPEYLDCIPRNIIIHGSDLYYIDREWALNQRFLFGTVVLRYLVVLFGDHKVTAFLSRHLGRSGRKEAAARLLEYFAIDITQAVVQNYVDVTNAINAQVFPEKPSTRPEEVWALLPSAQTEKDRQESAAAWHKRAYRELRDRMARSTHHFVNAIRVWWA